MIPHVPLLLGVVLWQQPQGPEAAQPPVTPADSTLRVFVNVGTAVADVRADLDHYRQLGFNDSNATGALLQAGGALRDACDQMKHVALSQRKVMCLHCLAATIQPPVNRYREFLPQLGPLGDRCAAKLAPARLQAARPAQLRAMVLELSTLIRNGLGPYEQRVAAVLAAMRAPAARTAPQPSSRRSP